MFRKWLVAVMVGAFMVGSLVGCEPEEGGGNKPGTKKPSTEKPSTEKPTTEKPGTGN